MNFFSERVTEGLIDYFGIVSKEEKEKIEDLVHSKFEGLIFNMKIVVKRNF